MLKIEKTFGGTEFEDGVK